MAERCISSFPEGVILVIMERLPLPDLISFVSTNKAIRSMYKSHSQHAVAASLDNSIRNPEFAVYFPFPEAAAANEDATEASGCTPKDAMPTKTEQLVQQPIDPANGLHAETRAVKPHLLFLRHACRVRNTFRAVTFFANFLHRIERHDSNNRHSCMTESNANQSCNETYRVLVFLAQNEVYRLRRCVRHCAFESRIFAQCDREFFDKIETPLPERWAEGYSGKEQKLLFQGMKANAKLYIEASRPQIHRPGVVCQEKSFQMRRMEISKLMTRVLSVTPARKIPEYETQKFCYSKDIVAGLIFMQMAHITWWYHSMLSKTCQKEDFEVSGYGYLQMASIEVWKEAVKVANSLKLRG
ncbi:hypothetical protein Dda_6604 [Drechslerella dactyloides]|uniref:F-box domain-containing protein n=1 Tax=Drechslerella dactyloides TaxID=74499 RepID=A0AAD6ITV2_DREDA|nr:hypothetical protein Dda_6604 [Drechslerella dactyloides]